MTHKKTLITALLCAAIILGAAGIYFFSDLGTAGTLSGINLNTKEGSLQFQVIDSNDNTIGTYGADIVDQNIVYAQDDTYSIVALSEELTGTFKLKVYKN